VLRTLDAQALLVVQIPVSTLEAFVRLRCLRADQQDDLAAIMAALRRLDHEPDIFRVT